MKNISTLLKHFQLFVYCYTHTNDLPFWCEQNARKIKIKIKMFFWFVCISDFFIHFLVMHSVVQNGYVAH